MSKQQADEYAAFESLVQGECPVGGELRLRKWGAMACHACYCLGYNPNDPRINPGQCRIDR